MVFTPHTKSSHFTELLRHIQYNIVLLRKQQAVLMLACGLSHNLPAHQMNCVIVVSNIVYSMWFCSKTLITCWTGLSDVLRMMYQLLLISTNYFNSCVADKTKNNVVLLGAPHPDLKLSIISFKEDLYCGILPEKKSMGEPNTSHQYCLQNPFSLSFPQDWLIMPQSALYPYVEGMRPQKGTHAWSVEAPIKG